MCVKCSDSWVKSNISHLCHVFSSAWICQELPPRSQQDTKLAQTHVWGESLLYVHVYKWMFAREATKWAPFQKPLFVLASLSSPFLLISWRTLACAWCPSKWEEPSANCAPLFKPSVIALQKPLQSPACCPCFCLSNSCVEVGCVRSSSRRGAAKIVRGSRGKWKCLSPHREWEKGKWQTLVQDAINNQFGTTAQETAWLALSSASPLGLLCI